MIANFFKRLVNNRYNHESYIPTFKNTFSIKRRLKNKLGIKWLLTLWKYRLVDNRYNHESCNPTFKTRLQLNVNKKNKLDIKWLLNFWKGRFSWQ